MANGSLTVYRRHRNRPESLHQNVSWICWVQSSTRVEIEANSTCFDKEKEDDGDKCSLEHVDIIPSDRDEAVLEMDPTLSTGEPEDELQYQRVLESDSSESSYTRETANFHTPLHETAWTANVITVCLKMPMKV
jgi:hypothetical protein